MKKLIAFLLCMLLAGCTKTLNDIMQTEPHFTGTVTEFVEDKYIIVETDEFGNVTVPLDVEYSDSMTHFSISDQVTVYYKEPVQETYPVTLTKVYAIFLIEPAHRETE